MTKKTKTIREQSFGFRAPGALSVQLVGDFTHWQKEPINLKRSADGVWQTSIQLKPGTYHYRFIVDGQWQDDPSCSERQPNQFGGSNCVCVVNGLSA